MIVNACYGEPICLGYETENDVEAVVFDKSAWIAAYGPGTFELVHKRRQDSEALPVAVDVSGGIVTWTITAADVAYRGAGAAQLRYYNAAGQIKASEIYRTQVSRSLVSDPDVPSPLEGWVEQVLQAAAGIQNMQADAETLEPGSAAAVTKTVDPDTGVVTLTFGIPEGIQGVSVSSVEVLPSGELRFYFSDGATQTVGRDVYSAMEALLSLTQEAQAAADLAQGKAEDAQEAAERAQTAAETAQGLAEAAQTAAEDAQTAAETAQGKAEDAQTVAETAQTNAEAAQTAAETAQTNAEAAQGKAETAQTAAEAAQTAAEAAAEVAEGIEFAFLGLAVVDGMLCVKYNA